ncbi:MAG: hypothetical protein R6X06_06015 [Gammaproteobacteria bacterium]
MNTSSVFLPVLLLASLSAGAQASTEIDPAQVDAITAACNQEARGAIDEKIYAENCIDDRLQALKELAEHKPKEKS